MTKYLRTKHSYRIIEVETLENYGFNDKEIAKILDICAASFRRSVERNYYIEYKKKEKLWK